MTDRLEGSYEEENTVTAVTTAHDKAVDLFPADYWMDRLEAKGTVSVNPGGQSKSYVTFSLSTTNINLYVSGTGDSVGAACKEAYERCAPFFTLMGV